MLADAPLEVLGQREEMWCVVAAALALDVAGWGGGALVLVLGHFPRLGRQHNRAGTGSGPRGARLYGAAAAPRPHAPKAVRVVSCAAQRSSAAAAQDNVPKGRKGSEKSQLYFADACSRCSVAFLLCTGAPIALVSHSR